MITKFMTWNHTKFSFIGILCFMKIISLLYSKLKLIPLSYKGCYVTSGWWFSPIFFTFDAPKPSRCIWESFQWFDCVWTWSYFLILHFSPHLPFPSLVLNGKNEHRSILITMFAPFLGKHIVFHPLPIQSLQVSPIHYLATFLTLNLFLLTVLFSLLYPVKLTFQRLRKIHSDVQLWHKNLILRTESYLDFRRTTR